VHHRLVNDAALPEVPELRTERLRLRGWRAEDAEAMATIYADPAVVQFLRPLDLEGTRQQIARFTDHWVARHFGLWAVEERTSGRLIGRIGLSYHEDWTASAHDAEVGWALARDVWGRGLATEGGAAALRYGFKVHKMRRIISIAHRDNVASQRVMQKLGMHFEGNTEWRGQPVTSYVIEHGG
jgi:RimJ/RimL family protein N-acetyltransferase